MLIVVIGDEGRAWDEGKTKDLCVPTHFSPRLFWVKMGIISYTPPVPGIEAPPGPTHRVSYQMCR